MASVTAMRHVRDYALIIAGMALYAIGFTVFILPHEVVTGGMAGFGTLVYFASGCRIPVAVTMYTVNIAMLAMGYRILGRTFVVRTVFGATALSLMIGALEGIFATRAPLVADITMSVVMGGVICGLGIGLYFSHQGSAGGTDTIAALLEKTHNITLGQSMAFVDVAIVTASFFLPFDGDMDARIQARVQTIVYGWASIVIYSVIANKIANADKQCIQFLILSPRWNEIARRVTRESGRGVTTVDGNGYWTGEDRKLLIVWCRRYDADRIYEIVRGVDETAYIIQSHATSVYGNGFDPLKARRRKPVPPRNTDVSVS